MRAGLAFLAWAWMLLSANGAGAHPLGNFSISHYSAIRVSKAAVELRYIIDMAEIPTFQEIQETAIIPKAGDPSLDAYLARKAQGFRAGLMLEVNGRRLSLQPLSTEIIFPPGAGGLPTMKIGILYKAHLAENTVAGQYQLGYRDENFPGRAGWKEIIATAQSGAKILDSSVPATDRSSQLSNYPTDLLNTPPQELEARVTFSNSFVPPPLAAAADSPAENKPEQREANNFHAVRRNIEPSSKDGKLRHASAFVSGTSPDPDGASNSRISTESTPPRLQANRQSTPRNGFTELMATRQLSLGMVLLALAAAVFLGGFHALEPGHGKTLVAAYLVGSQGTMRHAFLLGLIVTAAHTAGVYLLGGVTLYASQYIMPERFYPWLGILSGVMITALGLLLLARRYFHKESFSAHHHPHADDRHGWDHQHRHPHHHPHSHVNHAIKQTVSWRELLALGVSGGGVPCPAALVVLLSAVSMQRIGFGLLLIVAFSLGLAAVLIVIGLLMVSAQQFMLRFHGNGRLITHWLPLTSSAFILIFGIGLTWQALQSAGF